MRSKTSSGPRWGLRGWLALTICALFVIATSGCATTTPPVASVSLTREKTPPPCARTALPDDAALGEMATWTAAQWAVYAAKRDALYEGDIAACEADRDRRWKRAEALADAVDALQGPRPRRWLTRTR